MTERHPHRIRLYGGRSTHAARRLPISGDLLTACDYSVNSEVANHHLPATATVTCRACQRVLAKETRP